MECRTNLAYNDQLVMKAIPEAVLNYKEFSTRKEQVAEQLIKSITQLYQDAGKINDFVDILTAGFTGDESLVTNTILAFRAVLQQQGQHLTVATLEFVLQQVSVFLVQKSRNQSEAAVAFLITFIKVMPIPLVANHLETIVGNPLVHNSCRSLIGLSLLDALLVCHDQGHEALLPHPDRLLPEEALQALQHRRAGPLRARG